jgi:enamine deaminase RidA (YjgF/YER057c/UK114 family)
MKNLSVILEAAGSDFSNVVKSNVFLLVFILAKYFFHNLFKNML